MRVACLAALAAVVLLSGCGYVGPVLPPSPQIPSAITDLAVVERGSNLVISFTTPPRTTDSLPIQKFSEIEMRIGPTPLPFSFDTWVASSEAYEVPVPNAIGKDELLAVPVSRVIPAAEFAGKHLSIAVRTAIKKEKHYSSWSNVARIDVAPPLTAPTLKAEPTAAGYKLIWASDGPGVSYDVYRQGANDKQPVLIGTSDQPEYVDRTAQFDTAYTYTAVAKQGTAESVSSAPVSARFPDTFPPSVPSGVTALASADSIEVSWQRSPEPDLKGYYIYRSVGDGPFTRLGDLVSLPSFSDRAIEHGKTYRYEISAIDQKDNESAKSAAAAVPFP